MGLSGFSLDSIGFTWYCTRFHTFSLVPPRIVGVEFPTDRELVRILSNRLHGCISDFSASSGNSAHAHHGRKEFSRTTDWSVFWVIVTCVVAIIVVSFCLHISESCDFLAYRYFCARFIFLALLNVEYVVVSILKLPKNSIIWAAFGKNVKYQRIEK